MSRIYPRPPGYNSRMAETATSRNKTSLVGRVKQNRGVAFLLEVTKHYSGDSGPYLAASITYYGFLSLFPMLLLGLSVLGFALAGDQLAQTEWADRLAGSVPGLEPLIGRNIQRMIEARAAAGVLGLAGLAWTSMGAVQASSHALGRIFRRGDVDKGFVWTKAWALAVTAILGVMTLTGIVLAAWAGGLRAGGPAGYAVKALAAILAVGIDFLLFFAAYRLLTRGWGPRFEKLWKGALFGAVGWTILKLFGSWYAVRAAKNATAVYGTFGTVVGVLLLLYLASQLFLYGAELNAVLMTRKTPEASPVNEEHEEQTGDKSASQLVASIASDSATLIAKQVELARQELVESVTGKLKAAGAIGAAAVLGLLALVFLGITAASALDLVLKPWASRLIVAGAFLLITVVAVAFALRKAKPRREPDGGNIN